MCETLLFIIRNADKTYNWIGTPEVSDLEGVQGQNNANPSSNFNNHQLIKYKGKFYDPSYGVSYDSETELSEKAIEAFYKETKKPKHENEVGYDVDGNGMMNEIPFYPFYYIKQNPMGLQIKISPSIY